jgi:hypothetical protein
VVERKTPAVRAELAAMASSVRKVEHREPQVRWEAAAMEAKVDSTSPLQALIKGAQAFTAIPAAVVEVDHRTSRRVR